MGGRGGTPPSTGAAPDPLREAEDALKALREARDAEGQRRAADALEAALRMLRGQRKPVGEQPK
jgi:hypothetical protein